MIPEDNPFLDADAASGMTRSRMDVLGSRHHRYSRYGFPEGLAEVCLHFSLSFACIVALSVVLIIQDYSHIAMSAC